MIDLISTVQFASLGSNIFRIVFRGACRSLSISKTEPLLKIVNGRNQLTFL